MLMRLALRNLLRHVWRTLATVLGVGIGIAAVLATLSVGDNVQENVAQTLAAAAGEADLLVTPGAQGRAVFAYEELLAQLLGDPQVEAAYPVLNTRAEPERQIEEFDSGIIPGVDSGFQISGRDILENDHDPFRLGEGAYPVPGERGAAIATGFARQRGIAVGDVVDFTGQTGRFQLEITGLLDDSYGFASTNGGRVAVVPLEDLQEILRLSGRASHLELHLAPGAPAAAVQERLDEELGEEFTVTFPAASGNVSVGIIETIQAGLTILAVTLLALGGFMAYNTFMAGVVERRREYALLRTLCLTRGQVQQLALLEAAIVSVLGVVLGLLLGVLLAYGINRVNALALGIEFRSLVLPLASVLPAVAIGVVVALIAGLLPARSASATPPLAALRQSEEYETGRGQAVVGWLAILAGVVCAVIPWQGAWSLLGVGLAMAQLFLGFTLATPTLLPPTLRVLRPLLERFMGPTGKLGASFAQRNAPRNGVAIGTVVVGLALTVGVGSMVAGINRAIEEWIDTTIIGDLFVTSPVNFPAGFETEAPQRVEGLDQVSGVGLRVVRLDPRTDVRARSIALVLVDPERFHPETGFGRFQYIQGQGDAEQIYAALQNGEVLVANTIHDRLGIGRGDTVSLRTDEGFRDFPVGAVVVDFTGGGEAAVASIRDMDLFGGGSPDLFVMTVQPGADPEEVRANLLAAYPDLYLDATLNRDYRDQILNLTQRTFATTNALLVLAVLIAALGVANTLGMNLSTRKHELAVLRTFGLTRSGVGRVVTAEGIIVLSLGTILGLLSGLLLAHVITAGAAAITGFVIEPHYPWPLIVIALIASPLVGFIASYFPARRASRLSPALALSTTE